MKIRQFLNLPFQFFTIAREKWMYAISCTLFFMAFFMVYQPYGIYDKVKADGHTLSEFLMVLVLFSSIIFLVLTFSQFILRKQFLTRNYTVKQFFLWFLIDILLIVFLRIVVDLIFFEDDIISLENLFEEILRPIFRTALILSIVLLYPVLGMLVYSFFKQMLQEKKELEKDLNVITNHYKIASGNEELVQFLDEKNDCKLTVPMNTICVIESQNQYVSVRYIKNEKLVEQNIRTRFSKILKELDHFPSIIKCHRSYAVNLLNIEGLRYMNQKPNLILGTEKSIKIPVSKTFLKDIKIKLSLY
ncbi:hypothetical protein WH52_10355 [Tenacibaculum holothuriorum]|uniref:HTH LytTR-type domain-containing protein n=1 Tax=Tenacibaculum holothuriorum TaxID=1635173 RepID=A0A1Y2PBG1_9FLAO|nr:LytTR family DNA-binding domain-containing protein [Tenacibaculum holothuriorum]OSY87816.1 hypothetical protein WH52_10355 [Tenacibaculum holothuriorum]